jgi:hypothetical protein
MAKKWFDKSGYLLGAIPKDAVSDCTTPGQDASPSVEYWVKKLGFTVPRDKATQYLKTFGEWSTRELQGKSDEDLTSTVFWIACGYIKDNGEWFGLVE